MYLLTFQKKGHFDMSQNGIDANTFWEETQESSIFFQTQLFLYIFSAFPSTNLQQTKH